MKPEQSVRAVTLWQPWATLVMMRLKANETRPPKISWRNYRGKLLIHASSHKLDQDAKTLISQLRDQGHDVPLPQDLPMGAILGHCRMDGSLVMERDIDIDSVTPLERLVGNWQSGRLAIPLHDVVAIAPIAAIGQQGLWIPNRDTIDQIFTTDEPLHTHV